MVYRIQLTYDESIDILDVKYNAGSTIGDTLPPSIYEISDINLMIKSLLPKEIKLMFTIDDIRLKSKLTNDKTVGFTNQSSFCSILGFTQSHSGPLDDIEGFIQMIPGKYESERPLNNMAIGKVHLKCACFNGSIVNGI